MKVRVDRWKKVQYLHCIRSDTMKLMHWPDIIELTTLYWLSTASSSANACCLSTSSMNAAWLPFVGCWSRRVDAAALPNELPVEERAPIPFATFFCALLFRIRTFRKWNAVHGSTRMCSDGMTDLDSHG